MLIQLTESDDQILKCLPILRQLRPHLNLDDSLQQIQRLQKQGYQLAFLFVT